MQAIKGVSHLEIGVYLEDQPLIGITDAHKDLLAKWLSKNENTRESLEKILMAMDEYAEHSHHIESNGLTVYGITIRTYDDLVTLCNRARGN